MRFCNAITLLSLPLLSIAAPLESLYPTNGYEVGLFYVNWAIYARQHFVTDLPSDKLTKVTYAFANVSSETGEVFLSDVWADTQFPYPSDTASNDTASNRTVLRGNLNQLYKLKQQNRNLKTILSVGGWSFRQNFPTALATHATRTRFAESSLKLIADLGLDGFDIDWEYPETAADAANFIATAKLCRETYDSYAAQHANGYHFDLTISAPAGPKRYTVLPVREMDPFIDSWNLMAFDYMGPGFSNFTGHNANVYPSKDKPWTTDFNTEQAIEYYKENVVDSRKIVLGMPLYGRSFANTAGLGKPFNGTGRGSFEAGVLDFKVLPLDNSTVRTDHKLMASYSYDHNRREFVTFDTIAVQQQKTDYLKKQGLGGAWWWESSGDGTGEGSAVAAVGEQLGGQAGLKKQRNNLYYPLSKYENIRAFQGYY